MRAHINGVVFVAVAGVGGGLAGAVEFDLKAFCLKKKMHASDWGGWLEGGWGGGTKNL